MAVKIFRDKYLKDEDLAKGASPPQFDIRKIALREIKMLRVCACNLMLLMLITLAVFNVIAVIVVVTVVDVIDIANISHFTLLGCC